MFSQLFLNDIYMELSTLQLNYACTWSELDVLHYFLSIYLCLQDISLQCFTTQATMRAGQQGTDSRH